MLVVQTSEIVWGQLGSHCLVQTTVIIAGTLVRIDHIIKPCREAGQVSLNLRLGCMEISVVSHVQRSKASNGYKTNERFETALEMCLAGLEKLGDRAILQLVWVHGA